MCHRNDGCLSRPHTTSPARKRHSTQKHTRLLHHPTVSNVDIKVVFQRQASSNENCVVFPVVLPRQVLFYDSDVDVPAALQGQVHFNVETGTFQSIRNLVILELSQMQVSFNNDRVQLRSRELHQLRPRRFRELLLSEFSCGEFHRNSWVRLTWSQSR